MAALKEAERLGWPAPVVAFRIACALAVLGERERALAELERAASQGFAQVTALQNDPDLESLRLEPRFAAVVASVERNASPCKHSAWHRQLDFWLGEWEVCNQGAPQGAPVSTVTVTRSLDGCLILERWNDPGSFAEAFNLFDESRGSWVHLWANDKDVVYNSESGLQKNGDIVFVGPPVPSGPVYRPVPLKKLVMRPLSPGRIQHLGYRSSDEGLSWTLEYDMVSMRKALVR